MDRIEQIKAFLNESPEDCFLKHALALEYIKTGEYVKARQYFETNRHQDPQYIATYYHLGQLLEKMELPKEALVIYEEGMKRAKEAGDQHAFSELRSVYDELLF